jgi:hypothetical protein
MDAQFFACLIIWASKREKVDHLEACKSIHSANHFSLDIVTLKLDDTMRVAAGCLCIL